jgi:hypothetical protein
MNGACASKPCLLGAAKTGEGRALGGVLLGLTVIDSGTAVALSRRTSDG